MKRKAISAPGDGPQAAEQRPSDAIAENFADSIKVLREKATDAAAAATKSVQCARTGLKTHAKHELAPSDSAAPVLLAEVGRVAESPVKTFVHDDESMMEINVMVRACKRVSRKSSTPEQDVLVSKGNGVLALGNGEEGLLSLPYDLFRHILERLDIKTQFMLGMMCHACADAVCSAYSLKQPTWLSTIAPTFTMPQLKKQAAEIGLLRGGSKNTLIARIVSGISAFNPPAEQNVHYEYDATHPTKKSTKP